MGTITRSELSVELVPLGHASISLIPPLILQNTPSGTRYIIGVSACRFEGERIKASLKGSTSGDWLTGDPRCAWLNKIQAVAKGIASADMSQLDYEIFELR